MYIHTCIYYIGNIIQVNLPNLFQDTGVNFYQQVSLISKITQLDSFAWFSNGYQFLKAGMMLCIKGQKQFRSEEFRSCLGRPEALVCYLESLSLFSASCDCGLQDFSFQIQCSGLQFFRNMFFIILILGILDFIDFDSSSFNEYILFGDQEPCHLGMLLYSKLPNSK